MNDNILYYCNYCCKHHFNAAACNGGANSSYWILLRRLIDKSDFYFERLKGSAHLFYVKMRTLWTD